MALNGEPHWKPLRREAHGFEITETQKSLPLMESQEGTHALLLSSRGLYLLLYIKIL